MIARFSTILILVIATLFSTNRVSEATEIRKLDQVLEIKDQMKRKQYSKAIVLSNKFIKQYPKSHTGYFLRGLSYREMRKLAPAIRDFNKGISLEPLCVPQYNARADLFVATRQYGKALNDIRMTVAIAPGKEECRNILKKLCRRMKLDPKKELDKVLNNKNKLWIGLQANYKGNNSKALANYNSYIKEHPRNNHGYQYRGDYYRYVKQSKKACADYEKALDYCSEDLFLVRLLSSTYVNAGQNDKGIELLRMLCKKVPNKAVYFTLGKQLIDLKRYKEAIEVFTQITQQSKEDADAYRLRGDCYANLKLYQSAVNDYTTSIKLDFRDNASTYKARADVYSRLGKPGLARRDREKVKKLESERMVDQI